jgi:hypothetical protein
MPARSPPVPVQRHFTAYLMSMNHSAPRAVHSAAQLLSAGIAVIPFVAETVAANGSSSSATADSSSSYHGGSATQLAVWSKIAAEHQRYPKYRADAFDLVIEDDISRHPSMRPEHVLPALTHAARLAIAADHPFFYVGACELPRALAEVGKTFVLERGPNVSVGTRADGAKAVLEFARVSGSCAHAYAVRRRTARLMLQLSRTCLSGCVAMDQVLTRMAAAVGGVYVAGLGLASPSGPAAVGLFYQDRDLFPSVTSNKPRLYVRACSRTCHKRTLRTTFSSCYRMNSCWRRGGAASREPSLGAGRGAATQRAASGNASKNLESNYYR